MRLLGGVVVMVMLLLTVADGDWASAEVTCSYDAASRSVTVQLAGTITVIERVGAGIEASGQPCGGATLANTDSIVVNGTDQPDELLLNESVARFAGVLFDSTCLSSTTSTSIAATATTRSRSARTAS